MNKIVINGQSFETTGKNISVINGSIMVDGKLIVEGLTGEVSIKFEGELANLKASNVVLNGNVTGNVDCTSLEINGNVGGNADCTSLDIEGDIKGDVDATSIEISGAIYGKVKATTVEYN